MIDGPSGRNNRKADDCEDCQQRFNKAQLPAGVGGKQDHGHYRKAQQKAGGTNQRITSLSANKTIQFRPEVFLIQLKTSLAQDCQHHLSRRGFVTATDIMALIAQTVLFAGFAATMAWADILTRPHTATSASVGTSGRRKKRFLLML